MEVLLRSINRSTFQPVLKIEATEQRRELLQILQLLAFWFTHAPFLHSVSGWNTWSSNRPCSLSQMVLDWMMWCCGTSPAPRKALKSCIFSSTDLPPRKAILTPTQKKRRGQIARLAYSSKLGKCKVHRPESMQHTNKIKKPRSTLCMRPAISTESRVHTVHM